MEVKTDILFEQYETIDYIQVDYVDIAIFASESVSNYKVYLELPTDNKMCISFHS